MSKTQILVLNPSGDGGCTPDPDPWKARKNKSVAILNASGADQILSNLTANMMYDALGNELAEISIDAGGFWFGSVKSKDGEYTYEDGTARADPRTGTIDPS